MDWKVGESLLNFDNCFSLNFGYMDKVIHIPQNHINPESNKKMNFDSPIGCLIVMIGGKYLNRVGDVMKKVNSVTNDIGGVRPLAVFLMSDNFKENIIIDVDHGFERYQSTPVMVNIYFSNIQMVID